MLQHRRAIPVAAAAALLACLPDVEQTPQPNEILVARFDPATSVVPFPNDLALQSAASLPAGVTKTTLETFINAGGFPAAAVTAVLVPVRALAKAADGTYTAAGTAPSFDVAALNAPGAIAFLRYDVSPPTPVAFQAQLLPQTPATSPVAGPAIAVAPAPGALVAGGRYVVAVRSGLKTTDGRSLAADRTIALVAPNKSFSTVENWPPGITQADATRLEQLRGTFAAPLPWTRIGSPPLPPTPIPPATPSAAQVCQQALANPQATAPCWLPCVKTLTDAVSALGLCKPLTAGAADPFAAIDTVFPHEEIASIQTFNIAPAP